MSESGRGSLQRAAVYAGGFMGPFAGQIPGVILSEIGESFALSAAQAAICLPTYIIPFASLMLVSGSLAQSFGPARTLRLAYLGYVLASLTCALAPNWTVFLIGCVFGGASNAFVTPILLATLGRMLERRELGRGLGRFTSAQALGQLSAPGFGGLIALLDWRLAYASVALVALLLLIVGVPSEPGTGQFRLRRLLDGLSLRVLRISAAQYGLGIAVLGMPFLVAIQANAVFSAGPAERGLIVMSGGALAFVAAPFAGRAVDRWGAERVLVAAMVLSAAALGFVPAAGASWLLATAWGLAWAFTQVGSVAANGATLALPNGSAGISVTQSFRFFGSASAPVVMLPIYLVGAGWGFWAASGVLVVLAIMLAATRRGMAPTS